MEYMSTYIYAGLALVVVVGTMGYFGAFEKDTYTSEKCESGDQMSCADATITADGVIKIMFKNFVGRSVNVTNVTVTYDDNDINSPLGLIVPQRNNATLSIPTEFSFEPGNKEEFSYAITYTPLGSPRNYTVRGVATAKVEPPIAICGNDEVEPGEECEPPIETPCSEYDSRFVSGTLLCDDHCQFDTSQCVECPQEYFRSDSWTGDYEGKCCSEEQDLFVTTSTLDEEDQACCDDQYDCVAGGECFANSDSREFQGVTATCKGGEWVTQVSFMAKQSEGTEQVQEVNLDVKIVGGGETFVFNTQEDPNDIQLPVEPHHDDYENIIYEIPMPVENITLFRKTDTDSSIITVRDLSVGDDPLDLVESCEANHDKVKLDSNSVSLQYDQSLTCDI